jgi:hypothetical protein
MRKFLFDLKGGRSDAGGAEIRVRCKEHKYDLTTLVSADDMASGEFSLKYETTNVRPAQM